MSGSYGVPGGFRPTAGHPAAGRPEPRTAPLVAIGVFLGAVVLLGLVAFFHGI